MKGGGGWCGSAMLKSRLLAEKYETSRELIIDICGARKDRHYGSHSGGTMKGGEGEGGVGGKGT